MKIHIVSLLLIGFFASSIAAQEKPTKARAGAKKQPKAAARATAKPADDQEADLAALRQSSLDFVDAFNRRNSKAVAALWAEDGEYIDDVGRRLIGREAIEEGYSQFFTNNPKTTMRITIDSLRLLGDHTAIEDGRGVVDPPPAGVPGFSKYTTIHVKVNGKWLMASVRDTHVETVSAFRNVADLEWLIGAWKAEEHGVKTESTCRWIANKSFVERRYTITHVDGAQSTGVQLIGWNPLDGHVQSWNFSPDGGHAVGVWSPTPDGWAAEMRGVTGNGVLTKSINTLTRLDDNAYVWQSVERTAGESSLPDTGEIVLRRISSK
jgi:uncharacterized protein (TIGR02246 family)